jgi:hypothetical protein
MVDVEKIQKLLGKHFVIEGQARVDPITGVVDVDGKVVLQIRRQVTQLPVRFGHVTGSFECDDNSLTTLDGAPKSVGVSFYCDNNSLTNLDGAPNLVGGGFDCSNNQLTTLEGAPGHVGGGFYCNSNSLTTLGHAPNSVGGHFWCNFNHLATLEGAPRSVGGKFWVDYYRELPLLRVLQYNQIDIRDAPDAVRSILHKYAGTGKRGMLGAGVELTRAGFKDNARW